MAKSTNTKYRGGTTRSSVESIVMMVERRGGVIQFYKVYNWKQDDILNKTKPFNISKQMVWDAWLSVKANKGSAGVDGISIQQFEANLKRNLYKIWNRLSSGSYMPPAIKRVDIPKSNGETRPLGIPTVGDRVAQMVVKMNIEPILENMFHPFSFGYRPKRSAHDAVMSAKLNCWKHNWVIDLDIKGFFDNIDHVLLMKAIHHITDCKWTILYISRWLKAEVILQDNQIINPQKGTPQGGVISPVLANLFLHYVHDKWMQGRFPDIKFERYADDIIVHCVSFKQAKYVLGKMKERFLACGLEVHQGKTKIVCCNVKAPKADDYQQEFEFLGFLFRKRTAIDKQGIRFNGFLPAIRKQARKAITAKIRSWKLQRWTGVTLEYLAKKTNAKIRGWINYYAKFYKSEMHFLYETMQLRLIKWIMAKHKPCRGKKTKAAEYLKDLRAKTPNLFAHWSLA